MTEVVCIAYAVVVPWPNVLLRLGAATVCAAILGLEREIAGQPAGVRTHVILAVGAALAMVLSLGLAASRPTADPARLAAQVLSGIGFLGAGAILRFGVSVRGITTATGLWTVAVIGLACGAGAFAEAGLATVLVFVAMQLVGRIEVRSKRFQRLCVAVRDDPEVVAAIRSTLKSHGVRLSDEALSADLEAKTCEIRGATKLPSDPDVLDKLHRALAAIDGVVRLDIGT